MRLAALGAMLVALGACGGGDEPTAAAPTKKLRLDPLCVAPEGVSASPRTIDELVELVNALPMPVSIPCVVSSLSRPLSVIASSSNLSFQPAVSPRSPRLFILHEELVITVVPEGDGKDLLEVSQLLSDTRSIKGELEMPLTAPVAPELIYERIHAGSGTRCGACHLSEGPAEEISNAQAFSSRALRPRDEDLLELEYVNQLCIDCDSKKEPDRCAILEAIFAHGEVVPTALPATMSTFL